MYKRNGQPKGVDKVTLREISIGLLATVLFIFMALVFSAMAKYAWLFLFN